MKQPKVQYQHFQLPINLDAAPEPQPYVDGLSSEHIVPESTTKSLPIPSQQILPREQYKDYLQKRQLQHTESGSLIMSKNNLKLLCVKQGLYEEPELNSKLYLHFKCIEKIENLQTYCNLKTLYLENNVIRKIENLGCLVHLENLFLQHNMITKIENLNENKALMVLNLSYNNIFTIEGLSELPHLQNLTLTNNYLQHFISVVHLGECSVELTTLDLSSNRILADERLFDLVPQAKCLYLSGNPLVREITHYRRTVVGKLKNLLYLDQRAVTEDERLLAEKWVSEGIEGMKKVKAELEQKKQARRQEQKKELMKDINSHRSRKILLFRQSISELQSQIAKLQQFQDDPANKQMEFYYQSQIEENRHKIRELCGFIESLTCRIEGKQEKKAVNREEQAVHEHKETEKMIISQVQQKIQDQAQKQQISQQKQQNANPQPSMKQGGDAVEMTNTRADTQQTVKTQQKTEKSNINSSENEKMLVEQATNQYKQSKQSNVGSRGFAKYSMDQLD